MFAISVIKKKHLDLLYVGLRKQKMKNINFTDFGKVNTFLNLHKFCSSLFVPFIYSFDIGPILLQKQYPVPDRITAPDLKTMMAERGSEVVS